MMTEKKEKALQDVVRLQEIIKTRMSLFSDTESAQIASWLNPVMDAIRSGDYETIKNTHPIAGVSANITDRYGQDRSGASMMEFCRLIRSIRNYLSEQSDGIF